jgi:hypothetical protein
MNVPDDALVLEPREAFDAAIVGVRPNKAGLPVVVYSRSKVIDALMKHEGWSKEDAVEWFEYNIRPAWMGDRTPVYRK